MYVIVTANLSCLLQYKTENFLLFSKPNCEPYHETTCFLYEQYFIDISLIEMANIRFLIC